MNTDFLKLNQPILIASDHGGIDLKAKVISNFADLKFKDLGCNSSDSVDYPDYAHEVCHDLSSKINDKKIDPEIMGLLICGSGQGMAMTANKYKNIRAALCWNEQSALLARSHNNAQVLCLGARLVDEKLALKIIKTFFTTSFEAGRHLNRINKI